MKETRLTMLEGENSLISSHVNLPGGWRSRMGSAEMLKLATGHC